MGVYNLVLSVSLLGCRFFKDRDYISTNIKRQNIYFMIKLMNKIINFKIQIITFIETTWKHILNWQATVPDLSHLFFLFILE